MNLRKGLLVSLVLVGIFLMFGCTTKTENSETTSSENTPAVEETRSDVIESDDVKTVEESDAVENNNEVEEAQVVEPVEETASESVTLGILTPDVELERDSLALDFALETVDGEVVQLSDYRGKLVLVNFWALS